MAVWLSLSLSQGTPNVTARTTTVTAKLTIHYSGGSYDGTQPSGEITIDGQSFPFVKNFNYSGVGQGPATTGTGSTSITVTATVSYGASSSRTVNASASFSRASGGASGSITLTPISTGGSSGGGDDDDDNTEEWDPDNPGGGSGSGSGSESGSGGSSDSVPPPFESNVGIYGFWDGLEWGSSIAYIGYDEQGGRCAVLGFYTNQDEAGRSTSVDIAMKADGIGNGVQILGVALSSARFSNPPYSGADLDVYDPYQIAVTTMTLTDGQYSTISIPTRVLERDNTYYLYLWIPPDYYSSDSPYSLDFSDGIEIRVNCTEDDSTIGAVHIDTGSAFDAYQCYIDNGTGWDLAIPYVDNGTSWELAGE